MPNKVLLGTNLRYASLCLRALRYVRIYQRRVSN